MFLNLNANLEVAYGTTANHVVHKMPDGSTPPVMHRLPQINIPDMKEKLLSADILAMQRRIRGDKRQEYNAQSVAGRENKLEDRASASIAGAKEEESAKGDRSATADDEGKKTLDLEDVQPSDLKAMDLAEISPSLLAHPDGDSVNYTERERKLIMAVYGRKAPKHEKSQTETPRNMP